MKSIKTLMAIALAAGAISTASAGNGYNGNNVVYITGSTAFRSAANQYLYNNFQANLFATDKTATNTASAGNLYFTNCNVNGTYVDIAVYWSGSEAGIQSAASGTNAKNLPFFDYAKITNNVANASLLTTNGALVWYKGVTGYSFNGNITASSTNANTSLQKGAVCFTDTAQATSAFTTAKGYKSLTMTKIGIVPMGYYASKGAPISNITTTVINQLLSSGQVFGNLLSGNLTDTNVAYYMVGRFPDSGTRLTAHLVAKAGALSSALQFNINASSSGSITNLDVTGAGTVNGLAVAKGNNGYASGGTLCGLLTNAMSPTVTVTDSTDLVTPLSFTVPATNFVIAYAGVSDAAGTAGYTTNALVPLAYNGVVGRFGVASDYTNGVTYLDQGYSNIINGAYPFWAIEQVGYDAGTTNTGGVIPSAKFIATNAAAVIKSWNSTNNYTYLAPNIAISDMKVNRAKDGDVINNN